MLYVMVVYPFNALDAYLMHSYSCSTAQSNCTLLHPLPRPFNAYNQGTTPSHCSTLIVIHFHMNIKQQHKHKVVFLPSARETPPLAHPLHLGSIVAYSGTRS